MSNLLQSLSSPLGQLLCCCSDNAKLWRSTAAAPPTDEANGYLSETSSHTKQSSTGDLVIKL